MDDLSQAFFFSTFSQSDARRRLNILEVALEESLYGQAAGKPIEETVKTKEMSEDDRKSLLSFLSVAKLPKDHTALKKIISGLKDAILARPTATLTLAFEPNPAQVIAYGEWFREDVNPHVLLNFIFSAAVVGGCSISWQGKQVTYDLEYLMKQKRKEIIAVVDKFVAMQKKEVVI